MKLTFPIGALAATLLLAPCADAALIISTLNSTTTFQVSGNVNNGVWPAQQFSTDSISYTLDSVSLYLQSSSNADTSAPLEVVVYEDNGGTPGNELGVLSGDSTPTTPLNTRQLFTYNPSSAITLNANSSYYIALRTTGDGFYNWSIPFLGTVVTEGAGTLGDRLSSTDQGSNWGTVAADPFFFSVEGTAVPEPSSFALLACGALICLRRKR